MDRLEERLRSITVELAKITNRLGSNELPRILTRERAAKELSVSVSKLSQLIRTGQIFTVEIGRRRMVPAREIERLATPAQATPRRHLRSIGGDANGRKCDAEGEVAKINAALRKRR